MRIFGYVVKNINGASMNLLKINSGNTRAMHEICLELEIKALERR